MTACGASEPTNHETRTDSAKEICGLIDRDLVEQIVESGEISTRGTGLDRSHDLTSDPAECTVQDVARSQTVIQVIVGKIDDPAQWRDKLRSEEHESNYGTCHNYDSDPGYGYGCVYDSGAWVAGAGIDVIRSDRLLRVVVHHWDGATAEQRMQLAEDIARSVDRNVSRAESNAY